MEKAKKLLRFFLGFPITVLAFIFIGKIFLDNKDIIFNALRTLNPLYFIIGLLFFFAFFAVKAIIWLIIVKLRGHELPKRQTIFNYSLSEAKRYIPGSVFAFMGRMHSHEGSMTHKETLKGIGVEAFILALSALVFSMPAIIYFFPQLKWAILLTFIIAGGIALIKHKKLVAKYFDVFALYLVAWLFYGMGCLFVTISITPINPQSVGLVICSFVLSWLGGYLFFIAPMGLGVRELLLVVALTPLMPSAIATTVAVLSRVCMVLGEMTFLMSSYLLHKTKTNLSRINIYFLLVGLTSIIYFLVLTHFSFQKHAFLLTGRFDLGNMDQTVWNTSQGRFFTLTNPDGTEIVSRLAVHSDFILVLFAPFYLIWSDPRVLLLFQSLILSIGGIYVYKIAKHILKKEKLALALALSYYLNFWLHEQNLFDFHAVSLATTFLLATFYYLLKKRYVLFAIFLTLSCLTKENVLLVASGFGMYLFLKERHKVMGILIFIIPAIIFYYLSSVAIPAARGEAHFVLQHYGYLGDSLGDVIKNIFLKPHLIVAQLSDISTFKYMYYHLLPVGFLALISPLFLLFAIPDAAIYLLSANFEYRSYEYHFGAVIIPFLYIASVYAAAKLIQNFKKFPIEKALFYYIAVSSILAFYLHSPLPGTRLADRGLFSPRNSQTILQYISVIPPSASVASSNNVGAHLSHREEIYVVPYGIDRADFIVLFNEKKELRELINPLYYVEIVRDERNNFYMYRKKVFSTCVNCLP